MKEQIYNLEADFSNNGYYGTNLWTEEKYRVLSGITPVLLSAPHAVNHFREDDIRNAEKYTGALARYLSYSTSSYAIFQMFTHADPNIDKESLYKNAVINLVENYNLKLLLDIHSSSFKDDTDIDVVSHLHETLCGHEDLIKKLNMLCIKYGLKMDENNKPNPEKENEIIAVTALVCGIPSIRIVINKNNMVEPENNIKFKKICAMLEEFISGLDYKSL